MSSILVVILLMLKQIKLRVHKDKGDHERDANREDLLQFLNSTFGGWTLNASTSSTRSGPEYNTRIMFSVVTYLLIGR